MDLFLHGLFKDEESAARAVESLIEAEYEPEVISALMRVEGKAEEAVATLKTPVGRGAVLGTAFGAGGALLLATGGFLAAGPLLALAGGGATGALAGALGGLGRWKDEIDFPERDTEGMILVGVSTTKRGVERARAALASAHPERIHVSRKDEACEEVETGVLSGTGILRDEQR